MFMWIIVNIQHNASYIGYALQELYTTFAREATESGKPRLLLTAAVAAGKDKIDPGYEVKELAR